ncbi:conserved hypothetical protein [Coccidioides posadasii str. Silveira]|uniref:GH16 domain-containing protein n=1 Tax=Coccidioides posadasii (strain RMSCC 757 / Silveira) TaxID=443226 RepID=E9D5V9_COCPS|nr:conserved hypothetical protein [Coccidioides posadasii str. Silveira]
MSSLLFIILLGGSLVSLSSQTDLQSDVSTSNSTTERVAQHIVAPKCDCYVVSGPEPGYFQHYRFYDFRPAPARDTPKKGMKKKNDKKEKDRENMGPTGINSRHHALNGHAFFKEWNIQSWHRVGSTLFPISIVHSYDNVYITEGKASSSDGSYHLVLRSTRHEEYTSTAEVQTSAENILHCSYRVRMRLYSTSQGGSGKILPPPGGAVAGIFTYHSRNSESDIEILTIDPPNRVHYSNQPDWDPTTDEMIPEASDDIDIEVPWTDWADHRLDWLPMQSRWFLNNDLVLEKDYGVPSSPSALVLNLWSDGGQSVYMGVEWIQIAYNTSTQHVGETHDPHTQYVGHGNRWGERFRSYFWRSRWRHRFNLGRMKPAAGEPEKDPEGNDGNPDGRPVQQEDQDRDYDYDQGEYASDYDHEDSHSGDRDGGNPSEKLECAVVCQIDDVGMTGVPEVVWDASWEQH